MVRASSILASASFAVLATAQQAATTSVVSLLLPMVNQKTIVASVMTAAPDATKYLIACPSGMDSNDCGLGTGFTVVNGPSTLSVYMGMDVVTAEFSCKLDKSVADCTGVFTDKEQRTSSKLEEKFSDLSSYVVPVTITAGLEKLAAVTGTAGSTGTGATAPNETGASTGSRSQGSSTSSSTAGVPRITGNAAVMGAAALVGGAAMLL